MLSTTPAFNLKVVLKETGIAADTLRAWERRYGLPTPQRTAGGHRLYSQRDIEIVKWLIERQSEGFSISRAVDMYNDLLSSGTDPLANPPVGVAEVTPSANAVHSHDLDTLRQEWLKACMAYNEAAADQLFQQAFAIYPVETVITELLQRGLHEMGEMWYRNEASVQQEHFASGLAMRRLEALIAASPSPTRKETLLVACPPGEWHTFSLVMLNLILRRHGWNVVYLGANVPLARLEETVQAVKPTLIVMAAQQLVTVGTLRNVAELMASKGYRVVFGGRIFNQIPALRNLIPGEFLGENLAWAENRIEQLVTERSPIKQSSVPTQNETAHLFRKHRPHIERLLEERLPVDQMNSDNLSVANFHFGNALHTALDLGDVNYIASDIDWIKNLLTRHNIPVENLNHYLSAYAQATVESMGSSGKPIANWIDQQLAIWD